VKPERKLKRQVSVDDMAVTNITDTKKDLLCEISMNIPKVNISVDICDIRTPTAFE